MLFKKALNRRLSVAVVVVEDVPVVVGHGGKHLVVELLLRQVDNHLAVVLQGVLLGVGLLELAEHGARVHLMAVSHGDRVFHGGGVVGALNEDSPGGAFVAIAVVGQVEAVVPLALHQREVKLRALDTQPAVNVRVFALGERQNR